MVRPLAVVGAVAIGLCLMAGCDALASASVEAVLPPADGDPGRWIYLEGASNTRDVGGYTTGDGRIVRWKTVYRSAALSDLTAAGCEAFGALHVQMVIDLRDRLTPLPPFNGDAWCVFLSVPVVLLPVGAGGDDGSGRPAYVQTFRNYEASYRQAFELLAEPANLPLLYHCGAGKDRTGMMTALLLTLLDVDRETVIEDFLLSNQVGATVSEQAIVDLLNDVEAQGGIEAYLSSIGVSESTQAAIRQNLLE